MQPDGAGVEPAHCFGGPGGETMSCTQWAVRSDASRSRNPDTPTIKPIKSEEKLGTLHAAPSQSLTSTHPVADLENFARLGAIVPALSYASAPLLLLLLPTAAAVFACGGITLPEPAGSISSCSNGFCDALRITCEGSCR